MERDAILVTGASGFIAGHLISSLELRGCTVLRHDIEKGNIATCALDFEGVRHVFHLAGKAYVPDSWKAPRDFYETNVLGTANILEFCRRSGASVTMISSYVYGRPTQLPISEDHPIQPLNPYAHSKILAEEVGCYYRDHLGVPVTIVRPFNVYGSGQREPFLIPTLIRQALDPASDQIVVSDLRPRRDFVHVQDVVTLLLATMEHPSCDVFNVGSGQSVCIGDLVEIINGQLPHPKRLVSRGQFRSEEVLDVVADISRAETRLNWRPRITLADGLRETLEWTRCRLLTK